MAWRDVFPAILFKVSEAFDGELMTIHRLYLGEDAGKATIAHPKKAYGDFACGAIWLGEPSDGGELVKAEGPENALVCFMAGRPFVASAISGANLKNVLFMSTGEIGMAEKLSEERMRTTGGQTVRLVEIGADAGHGMGMFQTLHGFKEPKQLAEALNAGGRQHYGHAAPAFIRHLTGDLDPT